MSDQAKPVWHLVLMLIWYSILLIGSGGMALLGIALGSETYRGDPIPIAELVIFVGPLFVTAALLAGTIYCWNTGRQHVTYVLCGVSVVGILTVLGILYGVIPI
uniref:hypothetical protein n=1 Tax=uncultured Erythrobacter sp. TaxID=263913 RepID=UPI0026354B90|nr:hypothetical protein [uncultured Erythrobacter sp.]